MPNTGLTIENVQVVDAGKITADVTAATSATKGARTVGVTNPGDKGFGSKTAYVALKPGAVPGLKLTPLARAIKVENPRGPFDGDHVACGTDKPGQALAAGRYLVTGATIVQ